MEPLYLPQRKNKHSVFPNHTWRVLFCYMQMTVSVFCKKKQAKKRKRHGQIKQSPIWSLCNKHFEIILLFCTDGEKQHQRKKSLYIKLIKPNIGMVIIHYVQFLFSASFQMRSDFCVNVDRLWNWLLLPDKADERPKKISLSLTQNFYFFCLHFFFFLFISIYNSNSTSSSSTPVLFVVVVIFVFQLIS